MTYGWAILIIAIALGALYTLGIFNPANFAPKAPSGSCRIIRPEGPYTMIDATLSGVCGNELPDYVAQFNGQSSYVNISGPVTAATSGVTLAGWVYSKSASQSGLLFYVGNPSSSGYGLTVSNGACGSGNKVTLLLGGVTCDALNSNYVLPANQWVFLTLLNSAGTWYLYVNGNLAVTGTSTAPSAPKQNTQIGAAAAPQSTYFSGQIADVQVYNVSLSSTDVQSLYREGIGGIPVYYGNIMGWWPLDGDVNDYSGNANNGVPSGISFSSGWTGGYTEP